MSEASSGKWISPFAAQTYAKNTLSRSEWRLSTTIRKTFRYALKSPTGLDADGVVKVFLELVPFIFDPSPKRVRRFDR